MNDLLFTFSGSDGYSSLLRAFSADIEEHPDYVYYIDRRLPAGDTTAEYVAYQVPRKRAEELHRIDETLKARQVEADGLMRDECGNSASANPTAALLRQKAAASIESMKSHRVSILKKSRATLLILTSTDAGIQHPRGDIIERRQVGFATSAAATPQIRRHVA